MEGDLLCDRIPAYILQGVVFVGDGWCQGCYTAGILERGVRLTVCDRWEPVSRT
jgi:hypothetical protein